MTSAARFSGKTVIVTGAGSGIGRATAHRLADEGAAVVAVDVNQEALDGLGAEIAIRPVVGDLTAADVIERIVAAADGRIDGLANVAGIMDGFLPASEVDDATWDRVMGVNVTAPMRLIRAVLPVMVAAGSGSIVNVSSEAGLRGSAAGAAYTASKHAIIGLTRSVAVAYKQDGVRSNAVAPGGVATNIDAAPKSQLGIERLQPYFVNAGKPAEPEQLAAAITWLLSDDAGNTNGVVLASDGGWNAV
ncbi:SDR family NAD(P)-dependent oxidoreductase [Glycomyces harbinensis]|uniref:NADP-dependent 3-hydroxy acid dehydrogenase YdfG n=1 Tax=Glycomyces harbinensis TaxID=58114 RepID=A0A1G6ZXN7_9ACTN|nr:SDR family NAD(P)-dependent oxidoreductase [Glycomyces harbinensis]SDE07428.1 NADP-dependent 3-hydroxy acid dehydrogenase YdfG [Glycomyces harbinensis]